MASEPVRLHEQGAPDLAGEPTEPVDYAALNAVYAALLIGLVVATRRREQDDPIAATELGPLAAATFALSKVIAREKIGAWVREPFVEQEGDRRKPRGRRIRRAVGELVTCTRCVGAWSALGIVGLRLSSPEAGRIVTNVLAVSAANDWLQAGFRYATGKANQQSR
jgi:Protein of unknown function (DUF1360)